MNCVVCIKSIPAAGAHMDRRTGLLNRGSGPQEINPADMNALEAALQLRDQTGGSITVLTMGPAAARDALRQAAALGADRLVHLTDPAFAGADSYATAATLCAAIRTLGSYDLILCGRRSVDGETAQVGPQLAALLGVSCVTNCTGLTAQRDGVICTRLLEHRLQRLAVPFPALVTIYNSINTPRLPSLKGLIAGRQMQISSLTMSDLHLGRDECGMTGSKTCVKHIWEVSFGKRSPQKLYSAQDGAQAVVQMLLSIKDAREDRNG